MRLVFILTVLLGGLSGCAHRVMSPESMGLVDRTVSFTQLKENLEEHVGRYVLLGGTIASVLNTREGGELEVVQLKVDSDGRPEDGVTSEGRFLAFSGSFLDPLIFRPGMMVTLVGEVRGEEAGQIEGVDYTYPLIFIREMHLWKPDELYRSPPVFHFGFGIYHGF